MRVKPTFLGLAILLLGILLISLSFKTYMIEVKKIKKEPLIEKSKFIVGDVKVLQRYLTSGYLIVCYGKVYLPETGNLSDVNFYIMDEENYEKWFKGKNAESIIEKKKVTILNVSVPIIRNDTYYFIFDNTYAELYKKEVEFEAYKQYEVIEMEPARIKTLNNLGLPLVFIGFIIMIYGILKKPEVTWM
ncbi:MAG: hypothetical protein QXR82_05405 [Candidatus Bathyarchaeia archaeon]